MRVLHISDQHGRIPTDEVSKDIDVIICTGDLMPNINKYRFGISKSQANMEFQTSWIKENIAQFKHWIKDTLFLFISGNHDYVDPTPLFREAGINAECLNDRLFNYEGFKIYGFPYINYIGRWNYELLPFEMIKKVNEITSFCNKQGIDILACHSPFYQTLDYCPINYQNYGIKAMKEAIDDHIVHLPKAYLCGHIHLANRVITYRDMIVSNAAEVQHTIDIL